MANRLRNIRLASEMKQLEKVIQEGAGIGEENIAASWTDDQGSVKVVVNLEIFGSVEIVFTFPPNYPRSPPLVQIPNIFHPNVYADGRLCLSILESTSGKQDESWAAGTFVASLIWSIVNILQEPNTCSPANVDANKAYMRDSEAYHKENRRLAKIRDDRRVREETERQYELALKKDKEKEMASNTSYHDVQVDVQDEKAYADYSGDKTVVVRVQTSTGSLEVCMDSFGTIGQMIDTIRYLRTDLRFSELELRSSSRLNGPKVDNRELASTFHRQKLFLSEILVE